MQVNRVTYFVPTAQVKQNGQALTNKDLIELGYMAGRFGINLSNNPCEANMPTYSNDGVSFSINSCTADCFEENMQKSGIKFNCLA